MSICTDGPIAYVHPGGTYMLVCVGGPTCIRR